MMRCYSSYIGTVVPVNSSSNGNRTSNGSCNSHSHSKKQFFIVIETATVAVCAMVIAWVLLPPSNCLYYSRS